MICISVCIYVECSPVCFYVVIATALILKAEVCDYIYVLCACVDDMYVTKQRTCFIFHLLCYNKRDGGRKGGEGGEGWVVASLYMDCT